MIIQDLKPFEQYLENYTELRVQRNFARRISMLNGNITGNSEVDISGVSARVFDNGSWGFASNSLVNNETIKNVIKSASSNAGFLSSKISSGTTLHDSTAYLGHDNLAGSLEFPGTSAMVELIKEVDNYIQKKCPDLTARSVRGVLQETEKTVLTSESASYYSLTPRCTFVLSFSIEKDGKIIDLYEHFNELGRYNDELFSKEEFFKKVDTLYEKLLIKKEGIYADAGIKECILGSEVSGILAHEAFGHNVEADFILGGSTASEYLNKEAASPLVSITDFAHTAFGETCKCPIYADDEGTKAEDVVILENGILKNYMHSKESASKLDGIPRGNSRANSFNDEPLIRMRNTAILPGKDKLDDMIASIEDGYYLLKTSNGQADSTGEFMFGITNGYTIKNGKLDKPILDTTISGIAYDVLKTVDMVSDKISWNSGMCGKKQSIPVSLGGPAIKCRAMIGGK